MKVSQMGDLQKAMSLGLRLRRQRVGAALSRRAAACAGPTKSALRKLDAQPRRVVSVDTTSDPRYANRAARGHGVSKRWFQPRRSPRVCRPIVGQGRTSAQFRYLKRRGFEIKADKGVIYAVPLASVWGPSVKRTAIGRVV